MSKEIRKLEIMIKSSLDQLLSLLNELSKNDLTRLQELGKETIIKSDLPPATKSAVNAIFCVGAAVTVLARKEKEHDEENEDSQSEDKDDDQGEQNQSGLS